MKSCCEPKTINDILLFQAEKFRDKEFLIYEPENRIITYREFHELTLKTAEYLLSLGLEKGEKVSLMMDNSVEFLLLYFGTMRMGAVVVPINPSSTYMEVRNVLSHSNAKIFVTDKQNYQKLNEDLPSLKHVLQLQIGKTGYFDAIISSNNLLGLYDFSGVDINDPAVLLYTSGTTGKPKGIILSQLNLVINAHSISEALDLGNERMMCILPLFHTNGQVINVLSPLVSGGSVVLCKSFSVFSLSTLWEIVSRYKVSIIDVVPTILTLLLKLKGEKEIDTSSLKYVICGAAPLSTVLEQKFEEKFKCKIVQEYGLSEGTCVSSISSPLKNKLGSIGLPLKCNIMRVVDEHRQEVPNGQIGEIVIKGQNVMQGYYMRYDLTEEVIKGEWMHTGDLGKVDIDGYFYILGRKKDLIIKGGENIFPVDIENILYKHPSVSECVVVGVPDEIYGENLRAVVVLKKGHNVIGRELIDYCKGNLPSFWCPVKIDISRELPKTPSGKIIKRALFN